MLRRDTSLFQLCQILQGKTPPAKADWLSIIGLANKGLITPTLRSFTSQYPVDIPSDVQAYLEEIYRRNISRNDHLAEQLLEAVSALNSVEITPVLLKGTALLAEAYPSKLGHRLMADLDILVAPDQINLALDCLSKLGYREDSGSPDNPDIHFVALGRPRDVGQIDLHRKPPGPDSFYRAIGRIVEHCRPLVRNGVRANLPSSTYQALILICHDQLHDEDYRAARIDLRHLLDLRELLCSTDGIDWKLITSFPHNSFVRNAIETHLLTLQELLAVDIPGEFKKRIVPRFQCWRRLQQINRPKLRFALSAIALLVDCPGYLRSRGQNQLSAKSDLAQVESRSNLFPTWAGLKWMFYNRYLYEDEIVGKL